VGEGIFGVGGGVDFLIQYSVVLEQVVFGKDWSVNGLRG
jgi:hypothetical protein